MSVFTEKEIESIEERRLEVYSEGGSEVMEGFSEELIRILPRRIVGWGLGSSAFGATSRSVG